MKMPPATARLNRVVSNPNPAYPLKFCYNFVAYKTRSLVNIRVYKALIVPGMGLEPTHPKDTWPSTMPVYQFQHPGRCL